MAKDNKVLSEKEIAKKIKDLKIELLKSPTKRGRVKKEIARLLTMARIKDSRGVGVRGVGVSETGATITEAKSEGNKE